MYSGVMSKDVKLGIAAAMDPEAVKVLMGIPMAAKYILSSVIGWSKVVDMPNPPPRNIELIKNS